MLATPTYPPMLKKAGGGRHGHLSNEDAGQIARALDHPGLVHIVAAHLSRQNNRPDLARKALADALGGNPADIGVADQALGCDWVTL